MQTPIYQLESESKNRRFKRQKIFFDLGTKLGQAGGAELDPGAREIRILLQRALLRRQRGNAGTRADQSAHSEVDNDAAADAY